MNRLSAAVLMLLLAGCASDEPLKLTQAQQERCAAGGGCVLITKAQLQGSFLQGAQAGVKAALEEQGCKPEGTGI